MFGTAMSDQRLIRNKSYPALLAKFQSAFSNFFFFVRYHVHFELLMSWEICR
jgi:hypothetical protein